MSGWIWDILDHEGRKLVSYTFSCDVGKLVIQKFKNLTPKEMKANHRLVLKT
jgi:hypothetical protein